MDQATRVLSTPPTNTSATDQPMFPPTDPTRRRFLAVAAVASAVSAGTLAAATAMDPSGPAAVTISRHSTPDPMLALIAEKRAADAAHCEAIDAQDEAESGGDPDAAEEAFQRCGVACRVVNEADWRLATTSPATLAGVAAVLRFANEIEDGGMEWPSTDEIGPDGWHYQLRATMAAAIEALMKGGNSNA
jgi:hypothetical protein